MRINAVVRRFAPTITLLALGLAPVTIAYAQRPEIKSLDDFVSWVKSTHKAPFDREGAVIPRGGAAALKQQLATRDRTISSATVTAYRNIRVNQDRNPWPKAEIAAAVDPVRGANYVVMTNDFRFNYDHMFFHVSTDGGTEWTDDAMTQGELPGIQFSPATFQSDPGLSFDRVAHSFLSTISGNLIFDSTNNYENLDTEVTVGLGQAGGTYADLSPIAVDDQPCNGQLFGAVFTCDATLDKPFITTDTTRNSTSGTTYVYYTFFCLNARGCSDGNANHIPGNSSVILESHSPASGLPFTAPELVSGHLANTQFSSMVIDSAGIPHIFFDDFTTSSVRMYESTYNGTTWTVNSRPVATFNYTSLNNRNWVFRDFATVAPGCTVHNLTAFCAFSATQIVGSPAEATPSVYLAAVNLYTHESTISRVNDDPFRDGKHHFFPWATATPAGTVYVGWYDDRSDPFNTKVEYWVGKSTDSGKTFSKQQAVSDVGFNPCIGFPGCGFFGDYTQLVSGPDNVVHAAWTDTRDQASQQIWSARITW